MLPNLIIIGAMKAGTTSLHYYLDLHPEISMSLPKELDFFVEDKNWQNGITWYESHFTAQAKIHGESSVSYTTYPQAKNVVKRMYSLIPEAKLIYVLRDPIERIISHYIHSYANSTEVEPFRRAIFEPYREYLIRSRYYMQLEQFLTYYPEPQILIITQEDLWSKRQNTLHKIFRFLDVDHTFCHPNFNKILHGSNDKRRLNKIGELMLGSPAVKIIELLTNSRSGEIKKKIFRAYSRKIERPFMDKSLRDELVEYLKEDVDRLRKFTGHKFENWSI